MRQHNDTSEGNKRLFLPGPGFGLRNSTGFILSKEMAVLSKALSDCGEKCPRFDAMKLFGFKRDKGPGIPIYELMVWVNYDIFNKYGMMLEFSAQKQVRQNKPNNQQKMYSVATTLYVIPLYRFIGPW